MPAARIHREKKTIKAMIQLYCTHHHPPHSPLCADCQSLYEYALLHLDRCPFQHAKPTCAQCSIHCYSSEQRMKIQTVMRFAGPRMLLHHPILTLAHLIDPLRSRQK